MHLRHAVRLIFSNPNPRIPPVPARVPPGPDVPLEPPDAAVPGRPVPEGPRNRNRDGLVQPQAAAAEVVDECPARQPHPGEHEGEVAEAPRPPRQARDPGPERRGARQRRLQDGAGAGEQEEERREPPPRAPRHGGVAPGRVQERGLQEREHGPRGAGPRRAGFEIALADEPAGRSREAEAEGLVPPGAPEAGEAAVEDLGEGAGGARQVPGVRAEAEDPGQRRREREGEGAGAEGHLQGRHDGDEGQGRAPERERERGQGRKVRRQRLGRAVLGPEDEVGIGRHVDGAEVDDEVVGDDAEEEARQEELGVGELPRVPLPAALRADGAQGELVVADFPGRLVRR